LAATAVSFGCSGYRKWLRQPVKTVAAAIFSSRFSQMLDDTFYLAGRKASYTGMEAQFKQFRFQYAMIIYPSPKLHNRSSATQVGAVKLSQLAYSIGSYFEGRLFHNMNGLFV